MNKTTKGIHLGTRWRITKHPSMGHLCGYVRIDRTHPLYKVITTRVWKTDYRTDKATTVWRGYDHPRIEGIDCHGGITLAGRLPGTRGVWLGFDCAHTGDLVPALAKQGMAFPGDTYKDEAFVKRELFAIIDQISPDGGY